MKTIKRVLSILMIFALLAGVATFALASGVVNLTTTGKVYMRDMPSLDGKQIVAVPKGTAFSATDAKTDDRGVTWYYGSYDGNTGWVSGKYLSQNGKPAPVPQGQTFVTTGDAYLRKKPNLNGEQITVLPEGTVINATDSQTDKRGVTWYQCTYNKKTGWVSEKNLQDITGKPTPKPTPKPIDYSKFKDAGYYVRVTARSLNMRKEPSTEYAVIAAYEEGAILYAVKSDGKWVEAVDEANNRRGYLSLSYLEECGEPVTVTPNPVEINLLVPEDGIYPVAFAPENLIELNGALLLTNAHLFTRDTYDIVEIAQLKVGDTIVIDGEEVLVKQLSNDGMVLINGGLEEGGWNLLAREEDNCYVVFELDDAATYTDQGAVALPLSADVTYTDDANLLNHVEADASTLQDAVAAGAEYGYHQYNTTIRIEDGKIVEIVRRYQP